MSVFLLAGVLAALASASEAPTTVDPKIFDVPTVEVLSHDYSGHEDWWLLTTTGSDHRTVLYIDANSRSDVSGRHRVWLERVYENLSKYGAKRSRSLVEVDCRARLVGAKELRSFDDKGQEVPGYNAVIEKPELAPVPADTVYENVLFFLCDGKRSYDHLKADKTPLRDAPEVFAILNERERKR
jgi:hypothetical protein